MKDYPPALFLEEVKQVLEHLYDFPFLQNHTLTRYQPAQPVKGSENIGQRLRRDVIEAIETLNPGTDIAFRSPHARLYNLMQLHYVEAMTIQEVSLELSISSRQAYRDLRRGQESVAVVLWNRYTGEEAASATMPVSTTSDLTTVQSEIERIQTDMRDTDISQLLKSAAKAVERLAEQSGVSLEVNLPPNPLYILTNPIIAQQALVHLFSHTIQQAQQNQLQIQLNPFKDSAILQVGLPVAFSQTELFEELTKRLDWEMSEYSDGNLYYLRLKLGGTSDGITVLIVDDNQGLIDLLERYLAGHHCQVLSAQNGVAGLQLAQKALPDVIIVDVMMPEMDGWELLQRLRTLPATETTPIIVCSVFNDPELAYSLGASLFIPKPVNRDAVLSALQQLQVI